MALKVMRNWWQYIKNCTTKDIKPVDSYYSGFDEKDFNFTADDGYVFTPNEHNYLDADGKKYESEIIDDNHLKIHGQLVNSMNTKKIQFHVKAVKSEPVAKSYNLKKNLQNATTNFGNTVKTGDNEITITANDGYVFDTDGSYFYMNPDNERLIKTSIKANNSNKITININVSETVPDGSDFTLSIKATEKKAEPVEPFSLKVVKNLSHCTSTLGDTIGSGETTITFTAEKGYIFSSNGYCYYINTNTGSHIKTDITANNQNTLTITVNIKDGLASNGDNFYVSLNADVVTTSISSFTNIYNPTDLELGSIADERIIVVNSTGDGYEVLDIGTFISNLYTLPFTIDNNIITNRSTVVLGNHKTKTESNVINSSYMYVNLGNINVPETYKNNYDYLNTTCELFTPFSTFNLKPSDIIKHTISIKLKINLYNGSATSLVSNEKGLLTQNVTKIGSDIPFIQTSSTKITKSEDYVLDNDIKTCYIKVTRNIPNNVNVKSVKHNGTLANVTGYVEMTDINLQTNATLSEQTEIESLLQSGVYIND